MFKQAPLSLSLFLSLFLSLSLSLSGSLYLSLCLCVNEFDCAGVIMVVCLGFASPDEAGPGPVKSKYDALDFDTLLKESQKSLHR